MDKKLGMLLGLHVGDSLGASLEFDSPRDENNLHTEMIGGGAFDWRAGEPTDDTEMMLCLLRSLSKNRGYLHIQDVASHYLNWYQSNPKDIGNATRTSLKLLAHGIDPSESGQISENSQGNGGLMRAAPLALFNFSHDQIKSECAITHAHPMCLLCNVVFVECLKDLLNQKRKDEVYEKALDFINLHSSLLHKNWSSIPNLKKEEVYTDGFVIESLIFSFWAFYSTTSFEEALITIVNRGGDSDTTGAITGALCGAFYGASAIPERWLTTIKKRNEIEQLVRSLY